MKSASKGPGGAKAGASASGANAGPAKQVQKVKAIGGDQGTNSTEVMILYYYLLYILCSIFSLRVLTYFFIKYRLRSCFKMERDTSKEREV